MATVLAMDVPTSAKRTLAALPLLGAVLVSCFDHGSNTSSPSTASVGATPTRWITLPPSISITGPAAPITPPPGAQHSSIADVYVPPDAQLEVEDAGSTGERWDMMHTSYSDAVRQQEALLPVGRSLGGYAWCKKAALGGNDNTSWMWGGEKDALIVSVMSLFGGDSIGAVIVIRHGSCSTEPIPWR